MMNKWWFISLFWAVFSASAQSVDTTEVALDSMDIDTMAVILPDNIITNPAAIIPFFRKLEKLGDGISQLKGQKVNIVHVGDSHIQADLFTDKVRKGLQLQFGNGGRGLLFPHNLARTNGSSDIRFTSNVGWQNHRAVGPPDGSPVGLSGIALYTRSDDFAVELSSKTPGNEFNTIKIITPENRNSFDLATASRTITLESDVPKIITHKIRNGDVLGSIADKYNVTVAQLKKANRLRSNLIRAGRTLKIPTNEMQKRSVKRAEFIPLELQVSPDYHFYQTDNSLEKIFLLPNKEESQFALNGLILENKNSGILYHNIGVNGARYSDFNKYPLFFAQTPALSPDLAILSFGTNESFDKMPSSAFMAQVTEFVGRLREKNPEISILIVTPPPSLFKRKYPNNFVAEYARVIEQHAAGLNYAVWDLYGQMGGTYNVNRNYRRGLMASDRVHYSKAGYEVQGELLSKAIIRVYQDYLKNRN